ncbi:hypothetical protein A3Q35_13875 [Aeribacillus pallidus]|nr:hypothetical protein A3Q35_13875 [Aeribacillus pallidus]
MAKILEKTKTNWLQALKLFLSCRIPHYYFILFMYYIVYVQNKFDLTNKKVLYENQLQFLFIKKQKEIKSSILLTLALISSAY